MRRPSSSTVTGTVQINVVGRKPGKKPPTKITTNRPTPYREGYAYWALPHEVQDLLYDIPRDSIHAFYKYIEIIVDKNVTELEIHLGADLVCCAYSAAKYQVKPQNTARVLLKANTQCVLSEASTICGVPIWSWNAPLALGQRRNWGDCECGHRHKLDFRGFVLPGLPGTQAPAQILPPQPPTPAPSTPQPAPSYQPPATSPANNNVYYSYFQAPDYGESSYPPGSQEEHPPTQEASRQSRSSRTRFYEPHHPRRRHSRTQAANPQPPTEASGSYQSYGYHPSTRSYATQQTTAPAVHVPRCAPSDYAPSDIEPWIASVSGHEIYTPTESPTPPSEQAFSSTRTATQQSFQGSTASISGLYSASVAGSSTTIRPARPSTADVDRAPRAPNASTQSSSSSQSASRVTSQTSRRNSHVSGTRETTPVADHVDQRDLLEQPRAISPRPLRSSSRRSTRSRASATSAASTSGRAHHPPPTVANSSSTTTNLQPISEATTPSPSFTEPATVQSPTPTYSTAATFSTATDPVFSTGTAPSTTASSATGPSMTSSDSVSDPSRASIFSSEPSESLQVPQNGPTPRSPLQPANTTQPIVFVIPIFYPIKPSDLPPANDHTPKMATTEAKGKETEYPDPAEVDLSEWRKMHVPCVKVPPRHQSDNLSVLSFTTTLNNEYGVSSEIK